MYDIKKALRRFKPLIRYSAYRYAKRAGNFSLYEDVEAEGFLTLVKCCQEFPDDRKRFGWYFKRAWYNKLISLNRCRFQLKRLGAEVGIEEAESLPAVSERDEFIERAYERYQELCPMLSDDARNLLQMLIDPTPATSIAYEDFIRKQRASHEGKSVTGHQRFRIKLSHIRLALGMTPGRMWNAVREVKSLQLRGMNVKEGSRQEKEEQEGEGQVTRGGRRGRRGRIWRR